MAVATRKQKVAGFAGFCIVVKELGNGGKHDWKPLVWRLSRKRVWMKTWQIWHVYPNWPWKCHFQGSTVPRCFSVFRTSYKFCIHHSNSMPAPAVKVYDYEHVQFEDIIESVGYKIQLTCISSICMCTSLLKMLMFIDCNHSDSV